jgi:type VI secretion system secreted protein Hcp
MAVSDFLLNIDGIKGESTDSKHKDWIELRSFSWGLVNNASAGHGSGLGSGKVSMGDIHFTMTHCNASPLLMLACASGEHVKTATVLARKQGKDQIEFLTIKLTDVLVTSYQTGGSSGGETGSEVIPTDQFSLAFSKVEQSYTPQKQDGTAGAKTTKGWNVKENKLV